MLERFKLGLLSCEPAAMRIRGWAAEIGKFDADFVHQVFERFEQQVSLRSLDLYFHKNAGLVEEFGTLSGDTFLPEGRYFFTERKGELA